MVTNEYVKVHVMHLTVASSVWFVIYFKMLWDGFTDALTFAISLLLGLAYIVKIVLVKYKKDANVNRLTFLPYYVVLVYLTVLGVT